MVLLCGGLGVVGYMQGKQWATQLARTMIQSTIDESDLPDAEKEAIREQVDRVAMAYEEGAISLEELGQIMEELMQSDIWGLILVYGIEEKYLEPSGLSEEEKAAGRLAIDRILRGSIEGTIDDATLQSFSDHFTESRGSDPDVKQLKDKLTDEELRAVILEAETLADELEIPAEPYDVSISDQIREVVDQALGLEIIVEEADEAMVPAEALPDQEP